MKAVGKYVAVKVIKDSEGLIVVPESAEKNKYIIDSIGEKVDIDIKIGDEILSHQWITFQALGNDYRVCHEDSVLVVSEDVVH